MITGGISPIVNISQSPREANLSKVPTNWSKSMQVQFNILINTQWRVLNQVVSYYDTDGNIQDTHISPQSQVHKIISPQSNHQEDVFKHSRPTKDVDPQQRLYLQHC